MSLFLVEVYGKAGDLLLEVGNREDALRVIFKGRLIKGEAALL